MTKSSSYSTVNMVIYLIYSMTKWISTYSELLPSIGIPPIADSLLGILRDLIVVHLDARKRVDIFSLSIYGLVIFLRTVGHVDDAVSDLFDRLEKRATPILTILAETFRSLNA
ncbi:hypothetical protein Goshw_010149 [Gossypium schwendimanii]|uniref:Uncharacterized protein n=1 Tax=Gossypium schwendimanii TaxID=34291 RepID=A0A7J9NCQ8_GOSSC|nr:hypothetical protein [Gossypium schwendimanii]